MVMAKKAKNPPFFKNPNSQLGAALLLFIAAAVLARGGQMASWELSVFNFIYGLPIALTPFFFLITQLGNITVFFILAGVYFIQRQYRIVVRLFLSGLLAYLLAGVAKDLLGRPRPAELIIDVISRDLYTRGPGFPSGHAALGTAVALTLGYHLPKKYQWLVPVVVVLLCVSRIFLGVHAPLDVVGGFAIGWGTYALFRNVRVSDIHRHVIKRSASVLKKSRVRTKH